MFLKNMALQEAFERQGYWLFKNRSFLPLTILVIAALLYLRTIYYPHTFILKGTSYEIYYEMLALSVSLLGLAIRIYTVGHTPKNTSGRNTTQGQVADSLNTTGIYSIVRHPLYLGNFFMWFGVALLTAHPWFIVSFILLYGLYYERIMFAEESYLRSKFGKHFTDWAKGVPAFFPKFKNFQKPVLTFNWKKVFKKEKNGLLALFLLFGAADVASEVIQKTYNFNYFVLAMCAVSILCYFIVRIITKRKTL